jgi:hypothetical protein
MQLYIVYPVGNPVYAHSLIPRTFNDYISSRVVVCSPVDGSVLDLHIEYGNSESSGFKLCSTHVRRLERCNCT